MVHLTPIQALGTHWYIELLEPVEDMAIIQLSTEDFLAQFEHRYSRFIPQSWLYTLNQEGEFVDPDPQFVDILEKSRQYYVDTNGIFNIGIGAQMDQVGYDRAYSFTAKEHDSSLVPTLTDVLTISKELISLKSGRLDLGGIGKGYAIDALTRMYQERYGLQNFIINGGGDMYVSSDTGESITIALTHPQNQLQSIGSVNLCNQGFAASSPYIRAWHDKQTGERYNHLHTNNQVASYVVADTCCEADVFATTVAIDSSIDNPKVQILLVEVDRVIKQDAMFNLHGGT